MNKVEVSSSLRIWFVVHFFVDIIFAIPLIIFPQWLLPLLGFSVENLLIARLFGAVLVAIGTTSLLVRNASPEIYDAFLTLKLLFSGTAILGVTISILEGSPKSSWLFLAIFIFFFILWTYYKKSKKQWGVGDSTNFKKDRRGQSTKECKNYTGWGIF